MWRDICGEPEPLFGCYASRVSFEIDEKKVQGPGPRGRFLHNTPDIHMLAYTDQLFSYYVYEQSMKIYTQRHSIRMLSCPSYLSLDRLVRPIRDDVYILYIC